MKAETAQEFLQIVDQEVQSKHSSIAFEMAYQARIAVERIKFAIQQTENFSLNSDRAREANFQLLDALDRLQSAEQHFQQSYRRSGTSSVISAANGSGAHRKSNLLNGSEVQNAQPVE